MWNKLIISTVVMTIISVNLLITTSKGSIIPNQLNESKNCNYHIPVECRKRCIRETVRQKYMKTSEMPQIENFKNTKSRILMGRKPQILMEQNKTISKVENSRIRKLKESAFNHCVDKIVSQISFDISPIWLPIIRPDIRKNPYIK